MNKSSKRPFGGSISRRDALKAMGAVAATTGASSLLLNACGGAQEKTGSSLVSAAGEPLSQADARDLVQSAVETAKRLGASYADARLLVKREQYVSTEDRRVSGIADHESSGIGIRVIVDGAWGFAAYNVCTMKEVERLATTAVEVGKASATLRKGPPVAWADEPSYQDSYTSPREKNPFSVPFDQKVGLLLGANEAMLKIGSVGKARAYMHFQHEIRTLANSEGSLIESDVLRTESGIGATAIASGDAKTRNFEPPPFSGGYELIEKADFIGNAGRVGEEALEKLKAEPSPTGDFDLILLPSHLWLTIHESIGHATELDRVLGMEESLSGGSFATIDKLGSLRYGSPKINIRAQNTKSGYLASTGYDDDGVKCQDWDIIKEGVLVGYSTSREVIGAIDKNRSHGASRADSWASMPILRMANICMMPGTERTSLDDIIADTKNGILVDGHGSFSIDNKRLNFQFGGDAFWKIENGKRKHMLRDVTYSSITPNFWGSCDALCDERERQPFGTFYCGKGDPMQSSQISHSCVPARFRNISVRRAE